MKGIVEKLSLGRFVSVKPAHSAELAMRSGWQVNVLMPLALMNALVAGN